MSLQARSNQLVGARNRRFYAHNGDRGTKLHTLWGSLPKASLLHYEVRKGSSLKSFGDFVPLGLPTPDVGRWNFPTEHGVVGPISYEEHQLGAVVRWSDEGNFIEYLSDLGDYSVRSWAFNN